MTATRLMLAMTVLLCACAPGIKGVWKGTGEVGEGRFFQFVLDTRGDVPGAAFQYAGSESAKLAVCAFKENDGHAEFRMDPESRAASCDAERTPYMFVGDFGRDVLTGQVLDPGGRKIGLFRAFRQAD